MLEKLKEAEKKYEEIEGRLSTPEVLADTAEYTRLMREYKHLAPVIEAYRSYLSLAEEIISTGFLVK